MPRINKTLLILQNPIYSVAIFCCRAFSQSVKVLVTTNSRILNVFGQTRNRVWPSTCIGSFVGSNPQLLPDQVPTSYQCANTNVPLRSHSGPYDRYHRIETN